MIDPHLTSTPEIRDACRARVKYAIATGALVRPERCEDCGAKDGKGVDSERHTICGHHDDYTKPLVVRWLCVRCHHAFHSGAGHKKAAQRRRIVRERGPSLEFEHDAIEPGDFEIGVVFDPALVFARAFARPAEADDIADRTNPHVISEGESFQRSPFIKPAPSHDVLMRERAEEYRWQASRARERELCTIEILDTWRAAVLARGGWLPPVDSYLQRLTRKRLSYARGAAPAVRDMAAHREKCRAAALKRYARAAHQEAA